MQVQEAIEYAAQKQKYILPDEEQEYLEISIKALKKQAELQKLLADLKGCMDENDLCGVRMVFSMLESIQI